MTSARPEAAQDAFAKLRMHQSAVRQSRNAIIRSLEQTYFTNERDTRLEAALDEMIDRAVRHGDAVADGPNRNVGRLGEGSLLAVLGHSGAGKTRLLSRHFHVRPEFGGYGMPGVSSVLVTVQARAPFSLGEFARDLAKAAGADTDRSFRNRAAAFKFAMDQIRDHVLFVHIDEAQTFLESDNASEIQAGRNALRSLAQNKDWPVSIILSGLEETSRLFRDFQIARRQEIIILDSINLGSGAAVLRRALGDYVTKAKLANACDEKVLLPRLIHAGLEQLGECLDLMQRSIIVALRYGDDALRLAHFERAFHEKANAPTDLNVFNLDVVFSVIDVIALYEQKRGRQALLDKPDGGLRAGVPRASAESRSIKPGRQEKVDTSPRFTRDP